MLVAVAAVVVAVGSSHLLPVVAVAAAACTAAAVAAAGRVGHREMEHWFHIAAAAVVVDFAIHSRNYWRAAVSHTVAVAAGELLAVAAAVHNCWLVAVAAAVGIRSAMEAAAVAVAENHTAAAVEIRTAMEVAAAASAVLAAEPGTGREEAVVATRERSIAGAVAEVAAEASVHPDREEEAGPDGCLRNESWEDTDAAGHYCCCCCCSHSRMEHHHDCCCCSRGSPVDRSAHVRRCCCEHEICLGDSRRGDPCFYACAASRTVQEIQ